MLDGQQQHLNEIIWLEESNEELIRKYQAPIDVEEFEIREKNLPETDLAEV